MSLHFLLHVVWTDLLFLTSVFLSSGSRMGEILRAPPPQLTQNSASACGLVQGTLISRVEYCNAFLGRSTLNLFLESIRLSAQSGLWKTGLHVAPLHKPAVASPCVEGTARSSLRSAFLRPSTPLSLWRTLPPAVTPWLFLEHAPALGALAVVGTYVIGSGFLPEHSLPTTATSAPQRGRRHEEHKWAIP